MKKRKQSFGGQWPIYTGMPNIVPGGFNLDVESQKFTPGMVIPGGTLAIYNESTRLVKVFKTAKVKAIDATNSKVITLVSNEMIEPIFVVGESVLKTISGTFADAPTIAKIEATGNAYKIELSKAIENLAVGDTIEQVIEVDSNAARIGVPNCLVLDNRTVGEFETDIDVTNDTMQYAVFERRILPIPADLKENNLLKANPSIKLSQSY